MNPSVSSALESSMIVGAKWPGMMPDCDTVALKSSAAREEIQHNTRRSKIAYYIIPGI